MGLGSSLKKAAKKLTGGKAGNVAKNAAIFGSPTNTLIKLGRDGKLDDIAKGAAILGSPTNMLLYGLKKSGVSFGGGGGDDYGGGGAGGAQQLTPQQMQQQWQQTQWQNDMNGIFAKTASAYGVDPGMYQRQMQPMPYMAQQANPMLWQRQEQPITNMLLQAPPAFTGMPGAAQQPIAQQPIAQQPGGMQQNPYQNRMDRFRTPIFRPWGR